MTRGRRHPARMAGGLPLPLTRQPMTPGRTRQPTTCGRRHGCATMAALTTPWVIPLVAGSARVRGPFRPARLRRGQENHRPASASHQPRSASHQPRSANLRSARQGQGRQALRPGTVRQDGVSESRPSKAARRHPPEPSRQRRARGRLRRWARHSGGTRTPGPAPRPHSATMPRPPQVATRPRPATRLRHIHPALRHGSGTAVPMRGPMTAGSRRRHRAAGPPEPLLALARQRRPPVLARHRFHPHRHPARMGRRSDSRCRFRPMRPATARHPARTVPHRPAVNRTTARCRTRSDHPRIAREPARARPTGMVRCHPTRRTAAGVFPTHSGHRTRPAQTGRCGTSLGHRHRTPTTRMARARAGPTKLPASALSHHGPPAVPATASAHGGRTTLPATPWASAGSHHGRATHPATPSARAPLPRGLAMHPGSAPPRKGPVAIPARTPARGGPATVPVTTGTPRGPPTCPATP
jgi:hypothetical protein